MASVVSYCFCGKSQDPKQFMIQCDICRDWYHGSCVMVLEVIAMELDKYHCPVCAPKFGPSRLKPKSNWHRHNPQEPDADSKPVQTGTPIFIKELKTRHFSSSEDVILQLSGEELTIDYLQQNGFDRPILISKLDGLEMSVPSEEFTVRDVQHAIGEDRDVDVIDVTRQADTRMKLRDFVNYFLNPQRIKTLNVISLEFTNTRLATVVEAPYVARKLDWVNYVWPKEVTELDAFQKPEVQKYCLMSVKDSYTDFHVDFGGSSVWYHVLKGEKIFYLIKPTTANLSLYQRWLTSSRRSETFFADQVDLCYKCTMHKGQTMFLPTGWIHAVLTPEDSLVFGGNFLHSLNIPMQLQIYEIEKKTKTPGKFCFPAFETTNWYAAKQLLQELKDLNIQGRTLPAYLLIGVKTLVLTLKQWNQDKDFNKSRREQIPNDIEGQQLLKDLSKEVRHAERFMNTLNPPKPERESKRRKKKPIKADFIDFSEPHNLTYDPPAPLKLTIRTIPKTLKKVAAAASSAPSRPPLKLTLPKPATYPYSTNVLNEESSPKYTKLSSGLLAETNETFGNNPWSALFGDQYLMKSKHKEHKLSSKTAGQKINNESIYDFHDESDDEEMALKPCLTEDVDMNDEDSGDRLMIDEKPKKRKSKINPFRKKMTLMSDGPKNGIDELLKASGYAVSESCDPSTRLDDIESVQASPSTKEAIAGMLSMSMSIGDTNSSEDSSPKSRSKHLLFSDDYGENIDKVHQDDDYIYPTLDASDDEDVIFKPRGRRKLDEAWSPKARVGPLIPKTDRPMREGTKKQSVEKGLEAAAAKRAGLPAPKRPYNRKKVRPPAELVTPPPAISPAETSPKKVDPKSRKPRKGMATPKQRLGKILKIHKLKF